jgi:hypothetical protein
MADPVVHFEIIGKLVVGQFTDPEGNLSESPARSSAFGPRPGTPTT